MVVTIMSSSFVRVACGMIFSEPRIKYTSSENSKESVVWMFGWFGASQKNVSKYVEMYNRKGYDVVYYVSPVIPIVFPLFMRSQIQLLENQSIRTFSDSRLSSRPIVLHTFSNSGYYTYAYLSTFIKKEEGKELLSKVRCSILDSGPSQLTPDVMSKGLTAIIFPKILKNFHPMWTSKMNDVFGFVFRSRMFGRFYREANAILEKARFPQPELLLYSDTDIITKKEEIDRAMNLVMAHQKLDLTKYLFVGSDHVCHYKNYPKKYEKVIEDFLSRLGL